MGNRKIYISGKITGLCFEGAFENFKHAEEYLKSHYDCEVVNPMKEVPFEEGKPWLEYMLDYIKLLYGCDTIFMMNNWRASRGARIEKNIAEVLEKEIIFEV